MRNFILGCLLLCSCFFNAQNSIKGILSPNVDTDWLILYKIEGTQQVFINNTKIKSDSILVNGKKEEVGQFEIKLPSYAKPGTYRATFKLEGAGYVDFIYNKEDVSFSFNPEYPNQTVSFSKSEENKIYNEYVKKISAKQQTIDSIQIAVLQNPNVDLKVAYKNAYNSLADIQKNYLEKTKNKLVHPFVKATLRNNSPEVLTSTANYLKRLKTTYFDNIDFSDETLVNSSFLIDRVLEYVFYINYSEVKSTQQQLFKSAVQKVLSKITNATYKRDMIVFLIDQFEAYKNLEIIDYLFDNQYDKLPKALQDNTYRKEKEAVFATEIGRIAPDFSWTENGKSYKLSTLNNANTYVMVFWSTGCSHCLREIPQLHGYLKGKKDVKVIAFALENEAFVWETYKKANLNGWHNVLGLNKWQNKTARTYQINATPTYFVLDSNKKIIAKPDEFKDVKEHFEKM